MRGTIGNNNLHDIYHSWRPLGKHWGNISLLILCGIGRWVKTQKVLYDCNLSLIFSLKILTLVNNTNQKVSLRMLFFSARVQSVETDDFPYKSIGTKNAFTEFAANNIRHAVLVKSKNRLLWCHLGTFPSTKINLWRQRWQMN